MSRRNQNYDYAGMANANFSDNMPRNRTAPTFEGVAHGYPPQKPDYNGDSIMPPQYQQPMYAPPQYQQPMYAPPQYQQPMYPPPPQSRYQPGGYPTQGYQPAQYSEEPQSRKPKNNDKDIGNSYEGPMSKKTKSNGGYYDFSSNGSFTMKF